MNARFFAVCISILLTALVICFAAGCTSSIPGQSASGDPSAQRETAAPEVKETPVPETEAPIVETEEPNNEVLIQATPDTLGQPEPSSEPLRRHEGSFYSDEEFTSLMQDLKAQNPDTKDPLTIPIYLHDDIFVDLAFSPLGLAWGGWELSALSTNMQCVLNALPEFAFRKLDANHMYWVYDTDEGYRLFIGTDGSSHIRSHPVVLKRGEKLLRYEDFRSLSIGDPFENVVEVDPMAECYKSIFTLYQDHPSEYFRENFNNSCMSSIHYLSDGVLMIEYYLEEDLSVEVKNIIYSEDYKLPNNEGITTDYSICELDLP